MESPEQLELRRSKLSELRPFRLKPTSMSRKPNLYELLIQEEAQKAELGKLIF